MSHGPAVPPTDRLSPTRLLVRSRTIAAHARLGDVMRAGDRLADLRSLGHPTTNLPQAPIARPGSVSAGLGVRYVLEGSALGGAWLADRARERLGVERARGAAFLTRGRTDRDRWRDVRRRSIAGARLRRSRLGAALETFAMMEAWLCPSTTGASRPARGARRTPAGSARAGGST